MEDQEKKALDIENLEVTELEDADLDEVAGGSEPNGNCPCPINIGCPKEVNPN